MMSVEEAQAKWAEGIVAIGAAPSPEAAQLRAESMLRELYVADGEGLLFKPTKAAETPVRTDFLGSLSYFVGRNAEFAEDQGFALNPWLSVRFENAGVFETGDGAAAMGHYFFGDSTGSELKVEYSFVYRRMSNGSLKVRLHHSSLPYSG